MNKGILVPFDGSANAMDALREAVALSKALNETVILLNVQPSYQTYHTKLFFSRQDIREFQESQAKETMAPAEKLLLEERVSYSVKIRAGNPAEQICQEANGESDDCAPQDAVRMIVMGTRGMSPVVGSVLGSVSYGVLHQARCPVMIVPPCPESEIENNAPLP